MISPRYAPAIGGVERHAEELARRLVRLGWDVEVLTTDPGGSLPVRENRDGVRVRRFPTVASDEVFFVSPALTLWLLRHARRYRLLHAHSYHTPLALAAAFIAWRQRLPLVVTPHYHGGGHTLLRRLVHVPYAPPATWMMRRADAVVCVSRVERDRVVHDFRRRGLTVVIPNGVDVEQLWRRKAPPLPSSVPPDHELGPHILAVGRLELYKQPERVVEALRFLPTARLTIVGDGPAREQVEGAAAAAGVAGRVDFLAGLPAEQLVQLYRSADVFVTMSRHEAFGMTVLEAATAGAPVVASAIPAHREVSTFLPPGRVLLVDADASAPQLAEAIKRAHAAGGATEPPRGVPTWDDAADRTSALYAALLDERDGT